MSSTIPMSSIKLRLSVSASVQANMVVFGFSVKQAILNEYQNTDQEVLTRAALIRPGDISIVSRSEGTPVVGIPVMSYRVESIVDVSDDNGRAPSVEEFNSPGLIFNFVDKRIVRDIEQVEQTIEQLRSEILNKANAELTRLNANKKENDEAWVIGEIDFSGSLGITDIGNSTEIVLTPNVTLVRKIYPRL